MKPLDAVEPSDGQTADEPPTPEEVERIYRKHECIEVGPRLGPDD